MERPFKRKRSLQDDTADVSKMKQVMKELNALREELEGIQQMESELEKAMEHIKALEKHLESSKKPRMSFFNVTKKELDKLGIAHKRLMFRNDYLENLISGPDLKVDSLTLRLNDIYNYVNMDYDPGARMLLDAVLLSIAKFIPKRHIGQAIAILPAMKLAVERVLIKNPTSSYELWLNGNVDYAVIQYLDDQETKTALLGEDASRDYTFDIASGRLFLVEGKRLFDSNKNLDSHMPEAIAQALALSETSPYGFFLRDQIDILLTECLDMLCKRPDGERVVYRSVPRYLDKRDPDDLKSVRTIVELVLSWLSPANLSGKLYDLKD